MVNRPDPCGQEARRLVGLVPTSQSVNNDLRPPNNRHVVPINQDACVRLDLGDGSRRGNPYYLPGTADVGRRTRTAPVPHTSRPGSSLTSIERAIRTFYESVISGGEGVGGWGAEVGSIPGRSRGHSSVHSEGAWATGALEQSLC